MPLAASPGRRSVPGSVRLGRISASAAGASRPEVDACRAPSTVDNALACAGVVAIAKRRRDGVELLHQRGLARHVRGLHGRLQRFDRVQQGRERDGRGVIAVVVLLVVPRIVAVAVAAVALVALIAGPVAVAGAVVDLVALITGPVAVAGAVVDLVALIAGPVAMAGAVVDLVALIAGPVAGTVRALVARVVVVAAQRHAQRRRRPHDGVGAAGAQQGGAGVAALLQVAGVSGHDDLREQLPGLGLADREPAREGAFASSAPYLDGGAAQQLLDRLIRHDDGAVAGRVGECDRVLHAAAGAFRDHGGLEGVCQPARSRDRELRAGVNARRVAAARDCGVGVQPRLVRRGDPVDRHDHQAVHGDRAQGQTVTAGEGVGGRLVGRRVPALADRDRTDVVEVRQVVVLQVHVEGRGAAAVRDDQLVGHRRLDAATDQVGRYALGEAEVRPGLPRGPDALADGAEPAARQSGVGGGAQPDLDRAGLSHQNDGARAEGTGHRLFVDLVEGDRAAEQRAILSQHQPERLAVLLALIDAAHVGGGGGSGRVQREQRTGQNPPPLPTREQRRALGGTRRGNVGSS